MSKNKTAAKKTASKTASNKSATPKPAAQTAAPAASTTTEAPAGQTQGQKRAKGTGLPQHVKLATKVKHVLNRFTKLETKIGAWPDSVTQSLAVVNEALSSFAGKLEALPKDFRGGGLSYYKAKAIDIGSIVRITDKAKPNYEDIIDDADMTGLKVVRMSSSTKGKLVCQAKSGEKFILSRGHVAIEKLDGDAEENDDLDSDEDEESAE